MNLRRDLHTPLRKLIHICEVSTETIPQKSPEEKYNTGNDKLLIETETFNFSTFSSRFLPQKSELVISDGGLN